MVDAHPGWPNRDQRRRPLSLCAPGTKNRSRIHMLTVAASRLESEHANPILIADLRKAAKQAADARAEGRGWTDDENRRVEQQRTLFAMLPSTNATDRLKEAMLQRAYDLLWDGDCMGCDALIQFLPSKDVDRMFEAWQEDQTNNADKSTFYRSDRP